MQQPITIRKPKLPPVAAATATIDVHELLDTAIKLRKILAQETEHLAQMKIRELGALQQEKQRLTAMLESTKALLAANPKALKGLDDSMREELAEVMADFSQAVDDNYRRVAVARAINHRIVQAILDVVTEQQHAGTYTKRGVAADPGITLSFNLNQSA